MNKEQFLENEGSLYNQLALEIGEEAREKTVYSCLRWVLNTKLAKD